MPRPCACRRPGCFLPDDATARRQYRSDACRQAGQRGRASSRRAAAAARHASLEAAAEQRDLAALLELAIAQAELLARAPVLLRVGGRLWTLSAAELRLLRAGLAAAPAARRS